MEHKACEPVTHNAQEYFGSGNTTFNIPNSLEWSRAKEISMEITDLLKTKSLNIKEAQAILEICYDLLTDSIFN